MHTKEIKYEVLDNGKLIAVIDAFIIDGEIYFNMFTKDHRLEQLRSRFDNLDEMIGFIALMGYNMTIERFEYE